MFHAVVSGIQVRVSQAKVFIWSSRQIDPDWRKKLHELWGLGTAFACGIKRPVNCVDLVL